MQTLLKSLGFITIFIGILIGIYVISDALGVYSAAKSQNSPYLEQIYLIKLVAGSAIILTSIVSGMLYLSFGIVIELLDSINHKVTKFMDDFESKNKPKEEEDEFKF
jgi:hypothetical protein